MFVVAIRLSFLEGVDNFTASKFVHQITERHAEIVKCDFDESQSKVIMFVDGTEETAKSYGSELENLFRNKKIVSETQMDVAEAQSFERGMNVLTSKAALLLAKYGETYFIPVGLAGESGRISSSRLINLLGRFAIKEPRACLSEAMHRGLLEMKGDEVLPTQAGLELLKNFEVASKESDSLAQIFRTNLGWVVRSDGATDEIRLEHIFQQLMESGAGFEGSLSIVRKLHLLLKSLELDGIKPIVKDEEIKGFVTAELDQLSSNGQLGKRFSLLTNLVSREAGELRRLTRRRVREVVRDMLKNFGLQATRKQLITIADDVFEAMRRLTWGIENNEFLVPESLLLDTVRARLENSADIAMLRSVGREQASKILLESARKQASKGIELVRKEKSGGLPKGTAAHCLIDSIGSLFRGIIIFRGFLPWGSVVQNAFLVAELEKQGSIWSFATHFRDKFQPLMSGDIDLEDVSSLLDSIQRLPDPRRLGA